MAKTFSSTVKIYYEGYELTSDHNAINFNIARGELDKTAAGDVGIARMAGLRQFEFTHDGYVTQGAGNVEALLTGNIGTEDKIFTLCPTTGAVGQPAYSAEGVGLSYAPSHSMGEMVRFAGAAYSQGDSLVRGTVLATGAKTTTANGTSNTLGSVTAAKYLYGALHCTAVSGTNTPTITVKIQSAPLSTFLADVTDRITFTAKTAIGAQWATRVAGPITDTFWRASWTVSGTNPSLTIHCIAAIQGD